MATVPKRVADRFKKHVPAFQRVLQSARVRDVNESDTVTIVTDMLSTVFGYDKYSEITSEQAIRGTFCDLAAVVDGETKFLIEVKAIGLTLKENHLRQAVGYGANQGIQWVVLTNGIDWEIYRLRFEKPIDYDLVCSMDFLTLNSRKKDDHAKLFLLCKEGLAKAAIEEFAARTQILNRFVLAALIQSDIIANVLRREIRRLSPDVKVSADEIKDLLGDVLKRDVVEGEAAVRARRQVGRAAGKMLRKRQSKAAAGPSGSPVDTIDTEQPESDSAAGFPQ
ncbi:MAG: type I restriction enzyme HsdR N-terminal domain-containing protein [Candidatus Eisenbacteria sp.]|nr:type I restriction enzyme HsdR N-terminal domain-containing protein [Candidatus Eisenbacteria bacterium]